MKLTNGVTHFLTSHWIALVSILISVFILKEKKKIFVYSIESNIKEFLSDKPEYLESFLINETKMRYNQSWCQTRDKTKADYFFVPHQTCLVLKECLEDKKEATVCKQIALKHLSDILNYVAKLGHLKENPEKHGFIFGHVESGLLFDEVKEDFSIDLLEDVVFVCSEKPSSLPFKPTKIVYLPTFNQYKGLSTDNKKESKRKITCVFHTLKHYNEQNINLIERIIAFGDLFPELFYLIQTTKIIPYLYWQTLINSEFVICIGGTNGQSSCVYEAVLAGAIPIWISKDLPVAFQGEQKRQIPYEKICIHLVPSKIDEIPFILQDMSIEERKKYRKEGKKHKKMFRYQNTGEDAVFFFFDQLKSN